MICESAEPEAEKVIQLRGELREKEMKLTDIRLEALSSAHQLDQLREAMNHMQVVWAKARMDLKHADVVLFNIMLQDILVRVRPYLKYSVFRRNCKEQSQKKSTPGSYCVSYEVNSLKWLMKAFRWNWEQT